MPRGLPANVRQRLMGTKKLTVLDLYSILATVAAIIILFYYTTFITTDPTTAQTASIGIEIGLAGMLLGFILSVIPPQWLGRVVLNPNPITPIEGQKILIPVVALTGTSIALQLAVVFLRPQSALLGPSGPIDKLMFIQSMAIMEEWFFRFFFYRLMREAWGNWILGTLVTSGVFGFVYHQAVYHADPFLMTEAFLGSVIYCVGLQLTQRLTVPQVLHQIQNFRVS